MSNDLRFDEWDWMIDTFFEERARRKLEAEEPEIAEFARQMVAVNRTPLEVRTCVYDATYNKPLAYMAYYYAAWQRRSLL